jgi:hypothetical protein
MNAITPPNSQNMKTINTLADSALQLVRDLVEGKLKREPGRQQISRVPAKEKPPQVVDQTPFGYFKKPNHDGRTFRHIISEKKITVKSRNVYGKLIVTHEDGSMGTVGDRELELVYLAI